MKAATIVEQVLRWHSCVLSLPSDTERMSMTLFLVCVHGGEHEELIAHCVLIPVPTMWHQTTCTEHALSLACRWRYDWILACKCTQGMYWHLNVKFGKLDNFYASFQNKIKNVKAINWILESYKCTNLDQQEKPLYVPQQGNQWFNLMNCFSSN